MNYKLQIRPALESDLESILSVEFSAFPPHRHGDRSTFLTRLRLHAFGFLAACVDDELVAFTTGYPIEDRATLTLLDLPDPELCKPQGSGYYLRSVAVQQTHQRSGLGKTLISCQLARARMLGKSFFRFTASEELENYYSNLGFKRITEYDDFHSVKQAVWNLALN